MEKLNKLVELAKKATPGKWWIDSHGHGMVAFSGEDGVQLVFATNNTMGPLVRHDDTGNLSHWRNDNDATFIAAANPDTILAIAEAFRALEKNLAEVRQYNLEYAQREVELEQRAEAADAKLAGLEKQDNNSVAWIETSKNGFEKGQKIINYYSENIQNLAEGSKLFTRPAPADDLAELVPEKKSYKDIDCDLTDFGKAIAAQGWNDCRADMLAKLENNK